jgi:hypothetical protein
MGGPTNLLGVTVYNDVRRAVYNGSVLTMVGQHPLRLRECDLILANAHTFFTFLWNDDAFGSTGYVGNVVINFDNVAKTTLAEGTFRQSVSAAFSAQAVASQKAIA